MIGEVLADGHEVVRFGLRSLLAAEDDIDLAARLAGL
ncbi:MAG: hypothetical protein JWR64_2254 [Marmoricola sp.]|nr:hypothetical protein [Marmoricola sp.]